MTSTRFRVTLTPEAARNLVDQSDFYAVKSGQELARRWRTAVQQVRRTLSTMPDRGSTCNFASPLLKDIRRVEVPGFERLSLFYCVAAPTRTVLILMVLHEARAVEKLLHKQIEIV